VDIDLALSPRILLSAEVAEQTLKDIGASCPIKYEWTAVDKSDNGKFCIPPGTETTGGKTSFLEGTMQAHWTPKVKICFQSRTGQNAATVFVHAEFDTSVQGLCDEACRHPSLASSERKKKGLISMTIKFDSAIILRELFMY